MAIIRWNPWNISSWIDDELNLPTIPGLSRLGQGLNLYETNDSVIAEIALPGVPENRIDISIDDSVVRISGTGEEKEEKREQRRYYMSSMATSYNYSFRLPEGVATDVEPQASLDNGVLTLRFPKVQKAPPKRIKVSKKSKREDLSQKQIETKTKARK